MKIFFFVLLITHCSFLIVHSQWVWQNPLPQGNELLDMRFANSNTGYAVAPSGIIIKTTNSGATWSVLRAPLPTYLNALSVINAGVVYAAGDNYVHRTKNGGISWNAIPVSGISAIYSLYFINQYTGFAGGVNVIAKTTDGGLTWPILDSCSIYQIYSLWFSNENTGFAAGSGLLVKKTTNGGTNWSTVLNEGYYGDFLSMAFVNNNTGYVVGGYGSKIRKTTDGGNTWFPQVAGGYTLFSISYLDSNNLFACGMNGTMLKTTDGGVQWIPVGVSSPWSFLASSFLSANTIITCGTNGEIFKSTNGGNSWDSLSSGSRTSIYGSYFPNSQTGFAIGYQYPNVFKTTNSGNNWFELSTGFSGDFYSLYFADVNTGYISTGFGYILKTTNSGINWIQQFPGTSSALLSVFFLNALTGYTGGDAGSFTLYSTTDGGNNWVQHSVPPDGVINQIVFVNELTGYIATGIGYILKTTDSGTSWNVILTQGGDSGLRIDFVNANTGYGVDHVLYYLLKTTDSGNSWLHLPVNIPPYNSYRMSNIDFINANTGYVCGMARLPGAYNSVVVVSKTTDGGMNWSANFCGTNQANLSIFAVSADTCFVTGFGGTILRYTSERLTPIVTKQNHSPVNFTLYQNFPNPFNPTTKIKFDVPSNLTLSVAKGLMVKLNIYDLLGREIATLANEKLNPGTYEVEWNAANYPSGVYFYKLSAGDFIETKKMILTK